MVCPSKTVWPIYSCCGFLMEGKKIQTECKAFILSNLLLFVGIYKLAYLFCQSIHCFWWQLSFCYTHTKKKYWLTSSTFQKNVWKMMWINFKISIEICWRNQNNSENLLFFMFVLPLIANLMHSSKPYSTDPVHTTLTVCLWIKSLIQSTLLNKRIKT